MTESQPHVNVVTCAHVTHVPAWTQLCDHFKWHVHACDQVSQLLNHVTTMVRMPDLIILDMSQIALNQIQELVNFIQNLCALKFGKKVNMCVWVTDNMNKPAIAQVLQSAVQSVIHMPSFTHVKNLILAYEHILQGEVFYCSHVKHMVRNSEQVTSSGALMWCPSMCANSWRIHYQLLSVELPVSMHVCESLPHMLQMILDQSQHIHRVILDAHMLLNTHHMSMWEILNCVKSVHASVNPYKTLAIYVMVNCDADITQIRQIMGTNLVQGLMPMPDAHTTYEHVRNAVYDQICNKYHVPVRLQKRLDAKKTKHTKLNKQISLTPREKQIVELVCDKGYSNKTIAIQLQITESTVKLHLGNILKKMNVRNRTQLALIMKPTT